MRGGELEPGRQRLLSDEFVNGRDHPELIGDCIQLALANPEKNLLLLADLYPPHLSLSEILILTRNGTVIDFSSIYRGFATPSIVLGIGPETKKRLLQHMLPRVKGKFMCICEPQEIGLFKNEAEILEAHTECQMILRDLTEPRRKAEGAKVKPVETTDLRELDLFYRENGSAAWLPVQFESGPYFCVKMSGRIVSAAGVHFSTAKIAQLGNVMTAQAYRRRGYATLCTYELASYLSRSGRVVSLFVVENNHEAVRMYERIGFHKKRWVVFATLKHQCEANERG